MRHGTQRILAANPAGGFQRTQWESWQSPSVKNFFASRAEMLEEVEI
jgi:hypothetical protein